MKALVRLLLLLPLLLPFYSTAQFAFTDTVGFRVDSISNDTIPSIAAKYFGYYSRDTLTLVKTRLLEQLQNKPDSEWTFWDDGNLYAEGGRMTCGEFATEVEGNFKFINTKLELNFRDRERSTYQVISNDNGERIVLMALKK